MSDKQALLARLDACATTLKARADTMTGEYYHWWNDRAQLVRGWHTDVQHGWRTDLDEIAYSLEEFEATVRSTSRA